MTAIAQDRDRDRTAVVLEAEEEGGNNLSVPVIWGEASEALPLRGVMLEKSLNGACTMIGDQCWYHQQDPDSEWQAENVVVTAGPEPIDRIDWGDNLEARPWTTRSVIRVETVLLEDLLVPMLGFEMAHISGLGVDEMWGTNGVLYDSYEASAYTGCANLSIQRIADEAGEAYALDWDPATMLWAGDGADAHAIVNVPYSAEINVKGKVVYGYNWFARNTVDDAGVYRLTFSMHPACDPGLTIDETTELMVFGEGEAMFVPKKGGGGGGQNPDDGAPVGGSAHVDGDLGITYIDVTLTTKAQGGKGGPPR